MTRLTAALAVALVTIGLALGHVPGRASAQSYPDDNGAGAERGIEQLNNSGQVGTATLFAHGLDALVFVRIHGAERPESVRILRGPDCDALAPMPAFVLSDVHGGVSRSLVHVSLRRLLSGNYNVVVFASTAMHAGVTACGHLFSR
ncbi:MAG TPA: hypothetical protein VFB22_08315 [Candidatus Baltobacteraceae bacterium]|nr:hypothetical protein [Candidatus Baltobacteraceae bacterium]